VRTKEQTSTDDAVVRSVIGHLTKKNKWMRPSTDSKKQHHVYRPWFSWRTSTAPISRCWRDNTVGHEQSRRFLEYISDNFQTQVIEEPIRRGALMDLILTDKEGLTGDVKVEGILGCCDHEIVESGITKRRRSTEKLTTPNFRREDIGLLKDLRGGVPWDKALDSKGAREGWLIFTDHLLQAQV